MRMKEDPLRNGQLKPGYNLQIAPIINMYCIMTYFLIRRIPVI